MPHGLQLPLARPIVLQGDPPRTIDTFLAAVEFLASSEGPRSPEVEATIDQLIAAGQSGEPSAVDDVTDRLVLLLRQRGQL
ncbi:MAG: hypothetical protein K0S00_4431 [Xanthobacteraceae bacterium]|jgi:hypothetical protein|nr:hypothetical protein [Xanthobacteraceae bacterium]MDF2809339.1 hypothetical protein [Microvirga sp.]